VHLQNLLKKEDCDALVSSMREAEAEGKMTLDTQCPKSPAIHGLPALDSLMEQLTPYF
jgi:hypothetical protein